MTLNLAYDSVLSRVQLTGKTIYDSFTRTVSDGWGLTSTGNYSWSTAGGSTSDFSVTGTKGRHALNSVGISRHSYIGSDIADVSLRVQCNVAVLATGGDINFGLMARRVDASNYYMALVSLEADQQVTIRLYKVVNNSFTTLDTYTHPAELHAITDNFTLTFELVGNHLGAKVLGSAPDPLPGEWLVEATDSDFTSGTVGVRSVLSSNNTNTLPVNVDYDGFEVTDLVKVERSTDQVRWTTVRGGEALTPVAVDLSLDDYEFAPDVTNYYRWLGRVSSITPTLNGVWLKDIEKPFLNKQITVRDFRDISRSDRGGVFEVVGRSYPVTVSDVRGSKRWTLDIRTSTAEESEELDLLLSTGDILFVHTPATGRLSAVPNGYIYVGTSNEEVLRDQGLLTRIFSVQCTETAAPGADVIPAVGTCQTVINAYATCSDVLAAFATCADLLELVGSPADVIVS